MRAVRRAATVSSTLLLVILPAAGQAVVERGPYLQFPAPGRLEIRWRSSPACQGEVQYGSVYMTRSMVAREPDSRSDHRVEISGLVPEVPYAYSVGCAGGETGHPFVFRAPPFIGDRVPTRIWVIGDSGVPSRAARDVRDAFLADGAGAPPDVWLLLGDIAYTDGEDWQYQLGLFGTYAGLLPVTAPWPTFGNHDAVAADARDQSGPYFDLFSLPTDGSAQGPASGTEAYYSFDHANIHFVSLDSEESSRLPDGAMLRWLEEDLRASDREWVVAFWHHAPYSKGGHDSDRELRMTEMREHAVPLLESLGVDLVLAGHSHSYERSFLLDGHHGRSDTLEPRHVVDGSPGRPARGAYTKPPGPPGPGSGTVYVVAGSSSLVQQGALDHPAMAFSMAVPGSLILDVDGPVLDARFLDDRGIVRDRFRMVKGTPPVARIVGDVFFECDAPGTGTVVLDASSSTDAEGGERGGDLSRFEWFLDEDGESTLLGSGALLQAPLPLGAHVVRLVVMDDTGLEGSEIVPVEVRDTRPPGVGVTHFPAELSPANGRLVRVVLELDIVDACASTPLVTSLVNAAVVSGDGEIVGAHSGSPPDTEVFMRAVPGARYGLVYETRDRFGNTARYSDGLRVAAGGRRPATHPDPSRRLRRPRRQGTDR